ncbi:hypothetical protein HG536_0B02030 [Torulaspora globosa]|uniref:MRH domain-containing protein n=1 Tax=Torulaspora globosa TaxID=48254 RepID=A0A7G3ZCV4_9SACH|nr:uncharacterized protein HG536_0B02030 [Torulaspora globosa]QLL31340.1 hypothetical protein HG536_0B02030 [Torulaspora globosa]
MLKRNQLWKVVLLLLTLVTAVTCVRNYHDRITDAADNKPSPGGDHEEADLFCAVMNPTTGTFIDLSQLSSTPNNPRGSRGSGQHSDPSKTRWLVSGWGYYTNFTLGVCSSPVTADQEPELHNTTGAYYVDPRSQKLVSIGDFATHPTLSRAKKLTLQYDNGALCPNGVDRKSTVLSFMCDRDVASNAQITFVASVHDCAYFFEVRSVHACPTSARSNEVNVLGIFVGIFAVFFLVEFGGRRWLYGKVKTHFHSGGSG